MLGGGIGSGKTAAAACFAEFGACTVSTDDLAREVLRPGTSHTRRVIDRWPEVEAEPGVIDRRLLARLVFADRALLAELEEMTHPAVAAAVNDALERHPNDVVIVEIPLLRDIAGHGWPWIVVDAPRETRVGRAAGRGFLSEDEVRRVMESQPLRDEWLAAATWVIDNSGDLGHLERECARVWQRITGGTPVMGADAASTRPNSPPPGGTVR